MSLDLTSDFESNFSFCTVEFGYKYFDLGAEFDYDYVAGNVIFYKSYIYKRSSKKYETKNGN